MLLEDGRELFVVVACLLPQRTDDGDQRRLQQSKLCGTLWSTIKSGHGLPKDCRFTAAEGTSAPAG